MVDLDNIEFYQPQPSKSLELGPARSTQPVLPPPSFLPVAAACKALPRDDGFPLLARSYGEHSACGPARPSSFDVELTKFAKAEPQVMDSRTDNNLSQRGNGNMILDAATLCRFSGLGVLC